MARSRTGARWRRRGRRVRRRIRRWSPRVALGVLGLLLIAAAYVTVRGVIAVRHLHAVQRDVVALRASVGPDGQLDRAKTISARLHRDAHAAARVRHDPVWRLATHTPVFGSSLAEVTGVAQAIDDVSAQVVPAVLDEAELLPNLRDSGGRVRLELLHGKSAEINRAADRMDLISNRLAKVPSSRIGKVRDARRKLADEVSRVQRDVRGLSVAVTAGPTLLGEGTPRRYLLAVQNNAEARAGGGIVGAWGVLTADNGRLALAKVGSDTTLKPSPEPVYRGNQAFEARYAEYAVAKDWRQVTATPDFPTSATIMLRLWERQSKQRLDGVLSVDPVALARLLQATGPVTTTDGKRLTSDNVVSYTISDAYRLFPDKERRSAVLTSAARAVVSHVLSHSRDNRKLVERLGNAVVTHHLKFFSTDAAAERELQTTDLAGALPKTKPLLMVETQDAGASKLSYYLRRRIDYKGRLAPILRDFGSGVGTEAIEVGDIAITLTNTAPKSGLPSYVTIRKDLAGSKPAPLGQSNQLVSVYLGSSGVLDKATLDGRPLQMVSETEQGLAVFSTLVSLNPGQSRVLVLHVQQPTVVGHPITYVEQPLAVPDTLHFVEQADHERLEAIVR